MAALSTAVSAEVMRCSPQANRVKGTTLPSRAATAKWRHVAVSVGSLRCRARSTTDRTRAPNPMRAAATVVGVMPATATLMNRNDHPQMNARTTSRLTPASVAGNPGGADVPGAACEPGSTLSP